MAVDLTPLRKTIARLEAGLERYRAETGDVHIRDGLIQQFEFTFDMAPKMLRRVLERRVDSPTPIDSLSFSELLRTAFEEGFLDKDWPEWRKFRDLRTITSHTYDEGKAQQVADAVPAFLDRVRELARRLESAVGKQ
ncbi:MAG: nucleotidyltransferase substrate binding protein [Novosphingobium sp.]|nr:nucleotidyltransferase substrate binding protein [Novosphingobium sp.]